MKTQPRHHQQVGFDLTRDRVYWGYFWEQGLGKTKTAIDVAFHLNEIREINGVLVLAPNGVHLNWMYEEMPKHAWRKVPMAAWKANARVKERQRISSILKDSIHMRWFFMNIESIRTSRGFKAAEQFLLSSESLIIIDESTVIKNPKAKQTKAALTLARHSKYRRILTGTPITQGPLDLFSQIQFLEPTAIPITSYTAFKRTFAREEVMTMGNRSFTKVVGYRNLDYLETLLKPFTTRLKKEDCLDLPEKTYSTHYVELTKEQESTYQSIKETQVALLEQEQETTGMVSVTSVISALVKLKQVCCGFVIDDDKVVHDIPNRRMEALELLTDNEGEKYVIWAVFRHSVESIQRHLACLYGEHAVVSYYGPTHPEQRAENVRLFNSSDQVRFFVANRAASKGLTLTSASRAIFFANSESLEDRLQAEDRIHRIGQSQPCFYTDLLTRTPVEQGTLARLRKKQTLSEKVITSDWRTLINGIDEKAL